MWLIQSAMARPVTLMVVIITVLLCAVLTAFSIKVDIFPDLNLPVVYVVQPYGGMDPAQLEAFVVSHYENHFLYISGVDHIESKSIQNVAVMKVVFKPGTDMAEALANVLAQVDRSKAKLPPGTVSPFVLRFDAGNVPVGYVVMSSASKSVGQIEALADERVRPIISTIPGANTTHPFGANARSIVITVDPARLRALSISPEDVVNSVSTGNLITPSGLVKSGNEHRIARLDSTVLDIHELGKIPLRIGAGTSVYLADVCRVEDGMDIPTGWALVNGRRTVFLAVSKVAEASTVDVVRRVRQSLPAMRASIPEDIHVSFQFDQSVFVTEAVSGLVGETTAGAVLTGLMVLLFLRDLRSAFVVVVTIPVALSAALVGLACAGQTINIMTLGGLSLSVGVLVDEATVAIENIHTHLESGVHQFKAIVDACREVITPQLLAMLSVISVFIPSFFMEGTTKALFVPLSLSVGFAMAASYLLANTLVPVLSGWLLRSGKAHRGKQQPDSFMKRLRRRYAGSLSWFLRAKGLVAGLYAVLVCLVIGLAAPALKTEIFPAGNPSSFQIRLSLKPGTRAEVTEDYTKKILTLIEQQAGKENIDTSICYVGTQPPSFAVSNVYIWTSGPHEAVMLVAFKHSAKICLEQFRESLRSAVAKAYPETHISFESGDIINKIMNLGAQTPIQIDIAGADLSEDRACANRLLAELRALPCIRDARIVQPLEFPTVDVVLDRVRAGQLGVTAADVGRALIPAVYSSRFIKQIWWRDPHHGHSYQVQVQYPSTAVSCALDVESVPLRSDQLGGPFIGDVARVDFGTMIGEFDRYNLKRIVSITANIAGDDLGAAARDVQQVIERAGKPGRGMSIDVRGQVPLLHKTLSGLSKGLCLAVLAILLMLLAYFQRMRLAIAVLSVTPAIICGVVLSMRITDTTLNIQSFMGAIMAVGIGIANAILIVSFAESRRMRGGAAAKSVLVAAARRLRPVLMTGIAMIAGMIPMAIGGAEGGERTAPLGIAVIGGLIASLVAVLFILPLIYAILQQGACRRNPGMLYDPTIHEAGNA